MKVTRRIKEWYPERTIDDWRIRGLRCCRHMFANAMLQTRGKTAKRHARRYRYLVRRLFIFDKLDWVKMNVRGPGI